MLRPILRSASHKNAQLCYSYLPEPFLNFTELRSDTTLKWLNIGVGVILLLSPASLSVTFFPKEHFLAFHQKSETKLLSFFLTLLQIFIERLLCFSQSLLNYLCADTARLTAASCNKEKEKYNTKTPPSAEYNTKIFFDFDLITHTTHLGLISPSWRTLEKTSRYHMNECIFKITSSVFFFRVYFDWNSVKMAQGSNNVQIPVF